MRMMTQRSHPSYVVTAPHQLARPFPAERWALSPEDIWTIRSFLVNVHHLCRMARRHWRGKSSIPSPVFAELARHHQQ
jgi:hypothetical protein